MLDDLLQTLPAARVVDVRGSYIPIDLSASNARIENLGTSKEFESYISGYLKTNNAAAAYGGYRETRNLYLRSENFDGGPARRDIHIGIDIWAKAGTPVLAALDGVVHSFDYNAGVGNYGPTIILEHRVGTETFYTLYGHLSTESIENIEIGDKFCAAQQMATLGVPAENGDYAPHLHFQVIADIGNYFGDYPGVCAKNDLDFYLANCPNPDLLLKLK